MQMTEMDEFTYLIYTYNIYIQYIYIYMFCNCDTDEERCEDVAETSFADLEFFQDGSSEITFGGYRPEVVDDGCIIYTSFRM